MSKQSEPLEEIIARRLSRAELNVLLRVGGLRASRRVSKHRGGYRDYEIVNRDVSNQDIWISHEKLVSLELATDRKMTKYFSDGRRQIVSLIDLTPLGFCIYFNIKRGREKLSEGDMDYLHNLISDGAISFKSLSSDVMFDYLVYYDLLPDEFMTGHDVEEEFLSEDEREGSLPYASNLRNAIDDLDRVGVTNFVVNQLYDLAEKIDTENVKAKPRRKYLATMLKVIRDLLSISAAIAQAALSYLSYLRM